MKERLFDRHEREIAEMFGGRRTAASGAKLEKSDVVIEYNQTPRTQLLIECKSTQAKSFSISRDDLLKEANARALSRGIEFEPAAAIRFYGTGKSVEGDTPILEDWVMMQSSTLAELLSELTWLRIQNQQKRK